MNWIRDDLATVLFFAASVALFWAIRSMRRPPQTGEQSKKFWQFTMRQVIALIAILMVLFALLSEYDRHLHGIGARR